MNAAPHMYDAANIYNDGLPPLLQGLAAPAPGAPAPFVGAPASAFDGAPAPPGPAQAPVTR